MCSCLAGAPPWPRNIPAPPPSRRLAGAARPIEDCVAESDRSRLPRILPGRVLCRRRTAEGDRACPANNRDLRVAALNIEKSRAQYQIQRAELLPTVTHPAAAPNNGCRRILEDRQGDFLRNTVSGWASVPMNWIFRPHASLKDQALEQYLATEQARRSAQISLVAEVANAY